ncbi:ORF96-like protein [Bufonid herpesvirus 1]|uniref:ORF96-like protein n=1 Tax=Bufonid herpesvirus 1 TaxID=2282206 RepID=UPI000EB6C2F5|nr:ORF96-like protein [Bufonid herpesvirus 1]AXF48542.1 ORF96-like protein [Bufonid herpesvirus 1]
MPKMEKTLEALFTYMEAGGVSDTNAQMPPKQNAGLQPRISSSKALRHTWSSWQCTEEDFFENLVSLDAANLKQLFANVVRKSTISVLNHLYYAEDRKTEKLVVTDTCLCNT